MSNNDVIKQSTIQVTHTELHELLLKAAETNETVLVTGAPGIGKTELMEQLAGELGRELLLEHPAVSDPLDYKGLPAVVDNKAKFLPLGVVNKLIWTKKDTILFLDDFGQAPPAVQAALMQLILAREISGHRISDRVMIVAATNRKQDRSGVTTILEAVKSRFTFVVELVVDINDYTKWALDNDIDTRLIAFLRFKPALLHQFQPTSEIVKQPSPRSWSKHVNKVLGWGLQNGLQYKAIAGAVGEGAASEFQGFMEHIQNMPNIENIILNPTKEKLPKSAAASYTVATTLATKMNTQNMENIITYLNRIEEREYLILCIRDAVYRDAELQKTRTFIKLATDNEFCDLVGW